MVQNIDRNPQLNIQHDGALVLSTASSRHSTSWRNTDMQWSDLVRKLSQTTRTPETYAEYRNLSKAEQGQIKDVGGFVGGTLKGGRRKADAVGWRQLVTLDADFVKGDFWGTVEMLFDNACAVYSTHSHQPDRQKMRLLIPLSRSVTPEEYVAVSKRIAADLGIDMFDDTTYQPHRLMYWPSTATDAEYLFEVQDSAWLDPDEVLARYVDWRDPLEWPTSSRQQKVQRKMADRQGDPTDKPGMVGAFCRTYTIEDAIDNYLQDQYSPHSEGRYTYNEGSTAGGLVLYDDGLFAYSHHGTDPTSGLLVNAFDLVRIHLYGALDEDAKEGTPISRMPSTLAMSKFAQEDSEVKKTLVRERLADAEADFADESSIEGTAAPEDDENWIQRLSIKKDGGFVESRTNLMLILEHDPHLRGKFALDEFAQRTLILGDLPWRKTTGANDFFNDYDESGLRNYLEQVYDLSSVLKTQDALAQVFHSHAFHPVRQYLEGLTWDGVERLDTLLINTLGAEDTELNRVVTRKTLTAAVARVFNPGCKMDYMLTLVGPQGIGKSSLWGRLGGDWFSDSLTSVTGKEAYEQLQGAWIVEMGELSATRKADVESIKHFLTKRVDRFRVAYGRHVTDFPRQCIFIGTTNDVEFLRDATGNRRFWVMPVGKRKVAQDWHSLTKVEIGQLWAEAVERYRAGEALYLPQALEEEMWEIQKGHSEESPLFGPIQEHLERPVPGNFDSMEMGDRKRFFADEFGENPEDELLVPRSRVCALEIWIELFNGSANKFPMMDRREINSILRRMPGWTEHDSKSRTLRFGPEIGTQRAYIRAAEMELEEVNGLEFLE
ncbi:virulence-associated E family protein [Sporosarcina trichiuri]|uniref:virulence-associated E family protein n=1 Tax=Sporosarcina trichiuri TaxID=3056445 RepID=UPI0025B35054|nr:virulence-associated E family protein [Sporosarcina sp. 0.2-SM1T-5]WJY27460.1 virulence-associated E family protein [Sporosarcina sp. 0.2-SM1T-5]